MKVITLIKTFCLLFSFSIFLNSCETLDEKELKEKRDKETFEQIMSLHRANIIKEEGEFSPRMLNLPSFLRGGGGRSSSRDGSIIGGIGNRSGSNTNVKSGHQF
jgi:hypothetical protein